MVNILTVYCMWKDYVAYLPASFIKTYFHPLLIDGQVKTLKEFKRFDLVVLAFKRLVSSTK